MSYHIGKRTCETELYIRGREIIRFIDRQKEAGYHQVIWNGQDQFGHSLASGVYIYHLVTSQYSRSRKLLLLK